MATIRKLRSGNFQVIIKQTGLKTITKTFPTKRLAVQFQREAEGNAKLLNALGKPIPDPITFDEVVDQYMVQYTGKDPSIHGRLKYWCDLFGSKPILSITDSMVDDGLITLSERPARIKTTPNAKLAGGTINKYKTNLSSIFNFFNSHPRYKKYKFSNPVQTEFVSNYSESTGKERFLSIPEQSALLHACRANNWDKMYLLTLLALTTGGRRSELTGLTWGACDLTTRRAALKTTKNGKPRTLPLTKPVVEELIRIRDKRDEAEKTSTIVDESNVVRILPTHNNELIFHGIKHKNKPFEFRRAFERALKLANISNTRFHDLRHSCASNLANKGRTLLEIGNLLGHSSTQMTLRYSHLCIESKQNMVDDVLGNIGVSHG